MNYIKNYNIKLGKTLNNVIKNSGWTVIGQVFKIVALFSETILLTRYLAIDVFGAFMVTLAAGELMNILRGNMVFPHY